LKRALVRYRNSDFRVWVQNHQKFAPILFFIGGFIFDTLTLGRIDRTYDLTILCVHMSALSLTLYLFNLADDGKWEGTILRRFQDYFPLAIQFFFGGLSSAYVIYFFRSVSLSKTISFFLILVLLLLANELLKKRISNKYLQFGVYSFISFTFFAFMIPVFIKEMGFMIFIISGLISFGCTLALVLFIYRSSPSSRAEVGLGKLLSLIVAIYIGVSLFYAFKLIPPVPLAMEEGIVAHSVEISDNKYILTFEKDHWYIFWRSHNRIFHRQQDEPVYVFTSIFAPTDLKKEVFHRWQWYETKTDTWQTTEDISFDIKGGRDNGYRGYTFKNNIWNGQWKVEVMTEEELVLGQITFEIVPQQNNNLPDLEKEIFK